MVKIHWSVYLILGAGVLFASYKIDAQKFELFIWGGYLFLVIGIAKLGIWFINRKKESPAERRAVQQMQRPAYRNQQWQQAQQRMMRYCPRCGNGLRGYENFCPACGVRVR